MAKAIILLQMDPSVNSTDDLLSSTSLILFLFYDKRVPIRFLKLALWHTLIILSLWKSARGELEKLFYFSRNLNDSQVLSGGRPGWRIC